MGDDNVAAVESALVGTTLIGRYRIDRVVGRGGFGVVFAGHHLTLDVPIAVKVLHLDYITRSRRQQAFERFRLEAKTLAQLRHAHIARVMDTGVREADDDAPALPWLVMEWCAGPTLAEELAERSASGGLSRTACWRTMRPIIDAVAHAHEHGVVHRDLKPDNIILVDGAPRVLDFGIAKLMHEDDGEASATASTRSDMRAFTPAYAAPEQFAGLRTGPWTDVHALGLIMTELLTDRRAYGHTSGADLMREALAEERPTPARHGIDVGPWEAVLAKAMHATPTERYADAGKLLRALEQTAPSLDTVVSGEDDTVLDDTVLDAGGLAQQGRSDRPSVKRPPKDQPSTEEPLALARRDGRTSRSRGLLLAGLGAVALALAAWWWIGVRAADDGTASPSAASGGPAASGSGESARATGSNRVPAVVPTFHPYDELSIPLLVQRLEAEGWTTTREDSLRSASSVVEQINIDKGGQTGKLLIYRAATSGTMHAAMGQLTESGATARRGGTMLHVHLRGAKTSLAQALLDRMMSTPDPPLREAPQPIADSVWQRYEVPTGCDLRSVWGTSSSDVYAAGSHGVVIHFDGHRWQRESSGTDVDIAAIWGRGEELFAGLEDGRILRRSHGTWERDGDPLPGNVVGLGGNEQRVVAVGGQFVAERTARGWSARKRDSYVAVYAASDGVFVVHITGGVYRLSPGGRLDKVANWPETDGLEWPVLPYLGTTRVNEAPWLSPALDAGWRPTNFARVGTDLYLSGGRGKILHVEQGLIAKSELAHVDDKLLALWAAPDGVVFAVGEHGAVLRRPRR